MRIIGIMTCFNRREKTVNSIRKLIDGNPDISWSFIVADDNSSDGTSEELKRISSVTVIGGNGKSYYTGGMRLAIAEAQKSTVAYDYCLLFNDDVDFYDGSIEKLIHGDDSIWVGPTCDNEGNLTYGGVKSMSSWRPKYRIIMADKSEGEMCDTFNANCVLIPWSIFVSLGNMDSVYRHSLGDFDYGFKASKMGYTIKVSNIYVGACCENSDSGTWKDKSLTRRERIKHKESVKGVPTNEWFHYLRKNYSLFTACVYGITPYVRILFRR